MARLVVGLLLLIPLTVVGFWLAERPGHVQVEWLGYHIALSHMAVLVGLFLLLAVTAACSVLLYGMWQWPKHARMLRALKQHERGLDALTRGLSAYAMGEHTKAKHAIASATRALPNSALPHLLAAQANVQSNQPQKALPHFTALTKHKDTAYIGYKRLLEQAKLAGNPKEFTRLLTEARRAFPYDGWLAERFIVQLLQQEKFDGLKAYLSGVHLRHALSRAQRGAILRASQLQQLKAHRAPVSAFLPFLRYGDTAMPALEALSHDVDADSASQLQPIVFRLYKKSPQAMLQRMLCDMFVHLPEKAQRKWLYAANKLARSKPAAAALAAEYCLLQEDVKEAVNLAEQAFKKQPYRETALLLAKIYTQIDAVSDASYWQKKAEMAPLMPGYWQCHSCEHRMEYWQMVCPSCEAVCSVKRVLQEQVFAPGSLPPIV